MIAVSASPTVPPEPSRPDTSTPASADAASRRSRVVRSTQRCADRATPGQEAMQSAQQDQTRSDFRSELAKFILTEWMLSLISYELFAASLDPEARLLPTLGL